VVFILNTHILNTNIITRPFRKPLPTGFVGEAAMGDLPAMGSIDDPWYQPSRSPRVVQRRSIRI
jgi:hypothetical protein